LPKVKVNDIELYYEVHGEGTPLVMLHGFSRSSAQWKPFIPEYSKHFKLIIPDMRGRGHSANPSNDFSHSQSAHDTFALLDHLGIDRFNGIGTSSGGMTFLHMATQQLDRIDRLVLICTSPYLTKEAREIVSQLTVDNITDEQWELYRSIHHLGDDQIRRLREGFHRNKDSYDDNFTPPHLSTIRATTLIIHGDRDQFFPVHIPVTLYKSIPDSYLWILPNNDHYVRSIETYNQPILDFLQGKWETS
jgi:pimeloyl-ACP methyl ester carboxylesterase